MKYQVLMAMLVIWTVKVSFHTPDGYSVLKICVAAEDGWSALEYGSDVVHDTVKGSYTIQNRAAINDGCPWMPDDSGNRGGV